MGLAPAQTSEFFKQRDVYRDPLEGSPSSTGSVLRTGLETGLLGAGSIGESVEDYVVSKELGLDDLGFWGNVNYGIGKAAFSAGSFLGITGEIDRESVPLSKEEWEKSEFFRPNLNYQDGMTDVAADVLANRHDREQLHATILENANGVQKGLFFATTIASSMTDAKMAVFGLGAAGVVKGGVAAYGGAQALRAAPATGRAVKAFKYGMPVAGFKASHTAAAAGAKGFTEAASGFRHTYKAVAAEAAISTVPSSFTAMGAAERLQTEYSWDDFAFDMLASVGISIGLNYVGGVLGRSWLRHGSEDDIKAASDLAAAQLQNGEPVDVRPLVEMQLAEKDIPYTTLTKSEIDEGAPKVERVGRKNEYVAFFPNEEGDLSVVKGRGKTPEEATADLRNIYKTGDVARQQNITYSPEYYQNAMNVKELETQSREFDASLETDKRYQALSGESVKETQARLKALEDSAKDAELTRGANKAKKAKNKFEKAKAEASEIYKKAAASARQAEQQLSKAVVMAKRELVDMKKAEKEPQFKQWVERQVSDDPQDKINAESDKSPEYADAADDAPPSGKEIEDIDVNESADVEIIKSMRENENLTAKEKADLEIIIAQHEANQRLPDVVRNYISCVGRK